jgi:hypothetical protein
MSDPVPLKPARQGEDELIDGGSVEGFKELEFHEGRHRADTARRLAYLFVILLAASVGVHYLATVVLELSDKSQAAERLGAIFNSWLPVISSLVGAAAAYYFAKEKA